MQRPRLAFRDDRKIRELLAPHARHCTVIGMRLIAVMLPALLAAGCFNPDVIELAWPIDGDQWFVQYFVEHDGRDFEGGTRTYVGHRGTDVVISSFRAMDAGVEVRAVAAGEVIEIDDGHFDRETSFDETCERPANRVVVKHESGGTIHYLHFRSGTITVKAGDRVDEGAVLGLVGSSGCSDWPHVHVEVRDAFGVAHDPFVEGWWRAPPPYTQQLVFLEGWIHDGDLNPSDAVRLLDIPSVTELDSDRPLTAAVRYAGGDSGDSVRIDVADGSDAIVDTFSVPFEAPAGITTWTLPFTPRAAGSWELRAFVNDEDVAAIRFTIR